jgi:hypothetical protein
MVQHVILNPDHGEGTRAIEPEGLQIASNHFHRRNPAGIHRLEKTVEIGKGGFAVTN